MLSAKSYFAERLRELIDNRNISQARLAKAMNTTPQAISSYVNEKTTPDYDMLCNIAEFFGVTTDFLLGVKHTLSKEEDILLDEMAQTGDMDFNLLRTFRQFKPVRDNLRKLYNGHVLETISDNSLIFQFADELLSVCRKYSAIVEAFGYSYADCPEYLGAFNAFGAEFLRRLEELEDNADFHPEGTERKIIKELVRMENVLK